MFAVLKSCSSNLVASPPFYFAVYLLTSNYLGTEKVNLLSESGCFASEVGIYERFRVDRDSGEINEGDSWQSLVESNEFSLMKSYLPIRG